MKLQAVFWDYPQFLDEKYLRDFIQQHNKSDIYYWIMSRFLEHGRVIDTLHFFNIDEIAQHLSQLKFTDYSLKKWKRLIEVYSTTRGK